MEPLLRLASLSELRISHGPSRSPTGAACAPTAAFDLSIAYGDTVDKAAEIARLKKEIERLEQGVATAQASA